MRRIFRCSLRTWFVLFTLVAVGCYWLLVPAMRQRRAVQQVHLLAGQGLNPAEWANFTAQPIKFKSFDTQNPPSTCGEWIQHQLCQQFGYEYFGTAVEVNLSDAPFDEGDLEFLRHLRGMESLHLSGSDITDDSLAHVARCESLKKLSIAMAPITDRGIEHLRSHPHLEELNAYGTSVTDKAVTILLDLPKLKKVSLFRTEVSHVGERALRNAVPPIERIVPSRWQ